MYGTWGMDQRESEQTDEWTNERTESYRESMQSYGHWHRQHTAGNDHTYIYTTHTPLLLSIDVVVVLFLLFLLFLCTRLWVVGVGAPPIRVRCLHTLAPITFVTVAGRNRVATPNGVGWERSLAHLHICVRFISGIRILDKHLRQEKV